MRFKFPPTVSCSNGLPLGFNPCVGGEGLPWSDAIVPVKSRADRRVLGSEVLTLHSLAALLKGVSRFKESVSDHFPFPPRMRPFLPYSPLNKEKVPRAGEGNKLA